MRKILLLIGIIIALIVGAIIAIPLIFKDDILKKIQSVANEQINAKMAFSDVDLSVISHFPLLTVELNDLQIIGNKPFDKDTLINAKSIQLGVNIIDLISNPENPAVEYIGLKNTDLYLHVLKDGRANWDIAKEDTTKEETVDNSETKFNLALKKYDLENVNLIYNDKSLNTFVDIKNLNHVGKGNFTQDIFDLATKTKIEQLTINYDGTKYFNKARIDAKADINVNLPDSKYTFKQNEFTINNFHFAIDGFFQMLNDSSYNMSLQMNIPQTDFKELISLIPAVYMKDYENIKTTGEFTLEAQVKGNYQPENYPNFYVKLKVNNGSIQYPDLPDKIKDININLLVENKDPAMKQLQVNIPKFTMKTAGSFINAKFNMKGIDKPFYDTDIKANIDLEKLMKAIPMEEYVLKGKINADVFAKGQYINSTSFPQLKANVSAQNIYIKTSEYPTTISDMKFTLSAENPQNALDKFKMEIPNFFFKLDNEPVEGKLIVENLNNPNFILGVKGNIDLGKINNLYPMDDMEYKGLLKIVMDIQGDMQSIEKEQYHKIKAFGIADLKNFIYKGPELPYPYEISEATMEFSPKFIKLTKFNSKTDKSDINAQGNIYNYLGYALADKTLKGDLTMTSNYLNSNSFLVEEETTTTEEEDTTTLEAPEIPGNIDFTANANIKKLRYDTYKMDNFVGKVIIRNKKLLLQRCSFKMLDADFNITGAYNTENPKKPISKFALNITNLSIKKAFENIETFKKFVPIAGYATGLINLNFNLETPLTSTLEPVYDELYAKGLSIVKNAIVQSAPPLQSLAEKTRLSNLNSIKIASQKIKFEIKQGRLFVEPFSVNINGTQMEVKGSTGLDQTLDYFIVIDAPVNKLAKDAVNNLMKLAGTNSASPTKVKVKLKLLGTFTKPKVIPSGMETDNSSGNVATQQLNQKKEELEQKLQEAQGKAKEELEKRKKEIEDSLRKVQEELQKKAEEEKKKAEEEARKRAEELRKQKEEELRKKMEEERKKKEEEAKKKLKGFFKRK